MTYLQSSIREALSILERKQVLLCAKKIQDIERCQREKGHEGICRSWLDPEEEARMPPLYAPSAINHAQ